MHPTRLCPTQVWLSSALFALSLGAAAQQSASSGSGSQRSFNGASVKQAQPGLVLSHAKFSASQGGLQVLPTTGDEFGSAVASVGDVDGNDALDFAIGSRATFGAGGGGAWLLLMNPDGSIKAQVSLVPKDLAGASLLSPGDSFGASLAALGDLDADGISELAVGAPGSLGGDGSLWVLFMNADGTLRSQQRMDGSAAAGFGSSLAGLRDFNGDGLGDLAVGASEAGSGSFWMIYLNFDGTQKELHEIGAGLGGFDAALNAGDRFGSALASLGDLDGDGVIELAVGARGAVLGALWVLYMNADGSVRSEVEVVAAQPALQVALETGDEFGAALAFLGDLKADGSAAIAVGAPGDDDGSISAGSLDRGAVWILFLNPDGTLASNQKISNTRGRFRGDLANGDCFGESLGATLDFANSNTHGLLVGALLDDDLQDDSGSVYVLNLEGFILLDFETGADMMTTIPNGRAINPAVAYRGVVRVSADLVQNYGICVFDSDPGGPNDPGADPDLLVGTGNILILQEDPAQSLLGFFDSPDDCRFGGTFTLDFTGRVELRSMTLIDVDNGFDDGAVVTAFDGSGRRRIFNIPRRWTDDGSSGPSGQGYRCLDLRSLDPQPGFGSTATASEDPGFNAIHVLRLTISTSTSMAIDNLILFPFNS